MRIMIIRHAEPDYEHDSLTQKGFREAEYLSQRLMKEKIDFVYCSPLGRAQTTAKAYLEKSGKNAVTKEWLREFEGMADFPELGYRQAWDFPSKYLAENDWVYDWKNWRNQSFLAGSGTLKEYDWVAGGLDEILNEHGYERCGNVYKVNDSNTKTICFFCHFGVGAVLLSHLLNTTPFVLSHGLTLLPSSVSTIMSEEREKGIAHFRATGLGDLSHLYANDEEPSFAGRFCEIFDSPDRH